jgi:hypothetical protein
MMSAERDPRKVVEDDSEWLANLYKFLSETGHLTDAEVSEILRAEGIDPDKLFARGMTFIERLRMQATYRTLAEAREKQKQVLEALSNVRQPSGTLADLKAQVQAKWAAWNTQGTPQMAFAFRNLDHLTEADLRSFLADIERVERLSKPGEK